MSLKKVIFTSIVGDYDSLMQPEVVNENYDYICFSNDLTQGRIGVWKIRPIPYSDSNPTRVSRYVKILPHKVLADYDVSVWMDANIIITGDEFYDHVEEMIASGCLIAQVPHLERNSLWDEAAYCYEDMRISLRDAMSQMRHLKDIGFPDNSGMMENNLIFRRHNDTKVKSLSSMWWEEYLAYSSRDQMALMPVYWKEGFYPELLLGEGKNSRNVPYLKIIKHVGMMDESKIKGLRRLPWKVIWTWRKLVSRLLLRGNNSLRR